MKTVYIMIGCPGSGKTTWVKEHNLPSISRDVVRSRLGYGVGTKEEEENVTKECERQRLEFMCGGLDFAIDEPNVKKSKREILEAEFRSAGYRVVGVWMKTKLEDCLKRRNKDISEDIIARIWISSQDVDSSEFDELIEV